MLLQILQILSDNAAADITYSLVIGDERPGDYNISTHI